MAVDDPYAALGQTVTPESLRTPPQGSGGRFSRALREAGLTREQGATTGAAPFRPRPRPNGIAPGSTEAFLHMWQDIPPAQARQLYMTGRQRLEARITDPTLRRQALARFNSVPGNQALRQLAGLARVTTTREEIADVAERARAARSEVIEGTITDAQRPGWLTPQGQAVAAGVGRSLFGLPERFEAAAPGRTGSRVRRAIPRSAEGRAAWERQREQERARAVEPLNYDERLQALRSSRDRTMAQDPTAGFFGNVLGSLASGYGAYRLIGAGAAAASSSASPAVQATGNFIQRLTQLQRGQAVKNVGRVSLGGAVGGGAQAAGEGRNVLEGAAIGAAAAPFLHGAISGIRGAYRGVRNVLGFEPTEQILARYVRTPPAQIERRMAARARQGLPSSIYEVLPLRDRQALDDALARMPARARERVATLVRQRAGRMVQETAAQTQRIIQPRANAIRAEIANDLARSRGGSAPTPEEIALAHRASRSPLDMEDVADAEARNIMRPHDDIEAYKGVNDLLPQHPVQKGKTVKYVLDDPDVATMIRSAAGPLRIAERPVTVRDITAIMSTLSKTINRSADHIERGTADRAIQHLEDILARDHPDVLPAVQQMRDAYARRMRMIEGGTEGGRTRLRENVDPSSTQASRNARNAYDTPEGSAGRTLGQSAQLERDLGRSPDVSMSNLNRIASDPTAQAAISANLGNGAGEEIAAVARAQSQSARRLSRLDREAAEEGGVDGVHIMQNLMMLSPNTLPSTKAFALSRLVSGAMRIPQRQAHSLVNMLFSQNPSQISRAVGMLTRMGAPGRAVVRDMATGAFFATSGGDSGEDAPEDTVPPEAEAAVPDEFEALGEEVPDENGEMLPEEMDEEDDAPAASGTADEYDALGEMPRGQQIIESVFPGAHVTESARDPDSRLGRANPGSQHIATNNAVDVRPIPGMTFDDFIQQLRDAGHEIIESRDEVRNPSGHATGPHWHVVFAG